MWSFNIDNTTSHWFEHCKLYKSYSRDVFKTVSTPPAGPTLAPSAPCQSWESDHTVRLPPDPPTSPLPPPLPPTFVNLRSLKTGSHILKGASGGVRGRCQTNLSAHWVAQKLSCWHSDWSDRTHARLWRNENIFILIKNASPVLLSLVCVCPCGCKSTQTFPEKFCGTDLLWQLY